MSSPAAGPTSRPRQQQGVRSPTDRQPLHHDGHGRDDEGDEDEEAEWSDDDDDGQPKRKRARSGTAGSRPMSVSCELCKQRKVKCDRGQPYCGWCMRNGQVCEYKERKKPGLRAGYGRELEGRLDKLEGVIQAQQSLLQQLADRLPGRPRGELDIASPLSSAHHHQQHASHATDPALYAHSHTSYASAAAPLATPDHGSRLQMAGGDLDPRSGYFHHAGESSALNMQSGPSPVTSTNEGYATSNPPLESPSLNINGSATRTALDGRTSSSLQTVSQDHDLPPYDLLYALTDLFFRHINTWCPILHRRTTLDALFGPTTLDEADRILLHAIVATTLRFSSDPRLTDQARDQYHSMSKQKVLLYGLENSSVKALQALVILALDIVGNSNGPPGWNLLALITRSVVQLGLAVEATSSTVAPLYPSIYTLRAMVLPEPRSFIEDESRRRLFWMVYLLDRYATIATAFEFALDDKEIDRKLPCRDDLFARNQYVETRWFHPDGYVEYHHASTSANNKPEHLGSLSYYVEIVGILSQVHRFLKRPVDIGTLPDVERWQKEYRQLDSTLNAWKFGLPSEYGNVSRLFIPNNGGGNKPVNCIWVMLHVTYHTTIIRLHSSAAYPTTRSPIFTPSFAASQRCLTAVEDICALCAYVRANQMLDQLGPPFAFSLWVAARLLLVHGSTIDDHVNPAIGPLIETLRELGAVWRVAARYATLLQRVMDEYAESGAGNSAGAGGSGGGSGGARADPPSTVRILADMRRTAFDLDFLISRQPRQFFGGSAAAQLQPPQQQQQKQASYVPAAPIPAAPANYTPARTPVPSDLDAYDMFDFFNLPRLASGVEGGAGGGGGADAFVQQQQQPQPQQQQQSMDGSGGAYSNEFNITKFMYDANADWLGDMGK